MSIFWTLVTKSPVPNYSCIKMHDTGIQREKIEFIYEFYFTFLHIIKKINTNAEYKSAVKSQTFMLFLYK